MFFCRKAFANIREFSTGTAPSSKVCQINDLGVSSVTCFSKDISSASSDSLSTSSVKTESASALPQSSAKEESSSVGAASGLATSFFMIVLALIPMFVF